MPAKDLGVKHTCWKCGTKFYDLRKPSPACPKCSADPRAAPVVKPAAAERRRAAKEEVEEVVEPAEDAEAEEVEEEEVEPAVDEEP